MPYNLESPNGLIEPIDHDNLERWYVHETIQVESEAVRNVLHHVASHLSDFVQWPTHALLLWQGCDRVAPPEARQKYHRYPEPIRELAKQRGIPLDTRPNGPAISSFLVAGGTRPKRFGSSNAWSIHHLYSGKFPYINQTTTTHAIKECNHFTQSAGLIATHPVADALSDEFPFFAWLLRALAFRRFGYDPDGIFSNNGDLLGFQQGHSCEVLFRQASQVAGAGGV